VSDEQYTDQYSEQHAIAEHAGASGEETHRIGGASDFFAVSGEIATEEVYLPHTGRYYICRGLRQDQVARVTDEADRKPHLRNPLYLMYGVVTPEGKPVFKRHQLEDLAKQPAANVFPLISAIVRLSGLNKTPEDIAKEREAFSEAEDDDF
jgi:hypothetical protein